MNLRRFALEAATIAVTAILIALISNAVAPRDRKLALVGDYTNARKLTKRSDAPIPNRVIDKGPTATPGLANAEPEIATLPPTPSPAIRNPIPTKPEPDPMTGAPAPPVPTRARGADPAPTPAAPRLATRDEILRRFPATPEVQYEEISGDDAAWLHANGALFLDARRTSVYAEEHIAGARSFPVWEADIMDRIGPLANEITDQEMPIVVYCSGGACEDSHMLAEKLWGVFYGNVLVYKDGFPDWQSHGRATRKGDSP